MPFDHDPNFNGVSIVGDEDSHDTVHMDAQPHEVPLFGGNFAPAQSADAGRFDPYKNFKFTVSTDASTGDRFEFVDTDPVTPRGDDGVDIGTFNFEHIRLPQSDAAPVDDLEAVSAGIDAGMVMDDMLF